MKVTIKNWVKQLHELGACSEAVKWSNDYEALSEAWQVCEHGDWMLWYAGRLSGSPETDSRKKLVLAVCQCARLALPYVRAGETRPLHAIETAEAWANGQPNVTLKDVRAAAYAYNAYKAAATYSAAAVAANAVAYDAVAAAAAYAAYSAAAYDDYDAASRQNEILKQCADIVRKYYPEAPTKGE